MFWCHHLSGYFHFSDTLSRAVSNRGTTPVSIYYICCQSATHIWVIDPNMNHFSTGKQAFWLIYESSGLCSIHIWVALGEHIYNIAPPLLVRRRNEKLRALETGVLRKETTDGAADEFARGVANEVAREVANEVANEVAREVAREVVGEVWRLGGCGCVAGQRPRLAGPPPQRRAAATAPRSQPAAAGQTPRGLTNPSDRAMLGFTCLNFYAASQDTIGR